MSTQVPDTFRYGPKKSPAATTGTKSRLGDFVAITGLRHTFLTGAASLWDFSGFLVPRVRVSHEMVTKSPDDALAEDWEAVAGDLRKILPSMDDVDDGLRKW